MRVLSLGAGVQSSTLLLMACEQQERIDAAIFADTGWEPAAVYRHLAWLEEQARRASIPVYRVSAGDLRDDALRGDSRSWMPMYVQQPHGGRGRLKRQCTTNYKIGPIRRQLRALGALRAHPADVLIGISLDEVRRMRDSDVRYVRHVYPLVERRMTRGDCLTWLRQRGYPEPQKSACVGCPFRSADDWRRLTAEEFAQAVAFDAAMRWRRSKRGAAAYLHSSLVPLDQVDLRSQQDRGQLELDFDGCGVLCVAEEEVAP